jgi:hypothetical protein
LLGSLEYFFLTSGAIAEGLGRGSPCSAQSVVVLEARPRLGRACDGSVPRSVRRGLTTGEFASSFSVALACLVRGALA